MRDLEEVFIDIAIRSIRKCRAANHCHHPLPLGTTCTATVTPSTNEQKHVCDSDGSSESRFRRSCHISPPHTIDGEDSTSRDHVCPKTLACCKES